MLNKSKLFFVIMISIFLSDTNFVFAQGGPDPPPAFENEGPEPPPDYEPDGPEPPPPSAPINTYTTLLFVIGATYAGKKIYLNLKNSNGENMI